MAKKLPNKLKLKPGLNIGTAGAETDDAFLHESFLQTGFFDAALSARDPRFLVVGRTGSGKTALLNMVERTSPHVVRIDPVELHFQHIANSNIVGFISSLGVRIEPFFEMLWRYTFVVELIRARFNIQDAAGAKNIFERLGIKTKRARALDLLKNLSPEFWKSIDIRVTEANKTLERSVKGALGGKIADLDISAEGVSRLTDQKKVEYRQRVEQILGSEQLAALREAIKFLAEEVFDDDQNIYYVIIDDLDKEFAEDDMRVRLLKTLVETIRSMRPVRNVKFLAAIRTDLLDLVFEKTRDASFQQEKYEDDILNVTWTPNDLFEVVNRRINLLFKRVYTKDKVDFYDLFSEEVNRKPTREYIIERTLLRPRDCILFVNKCLDKAQNSTSITASHVKLAEADYSASRFISLRDEWGSVYPRLDLYVKPLRQKLANFHLREVEEAAIYDLLLELAAAGQDTSDRLTAHAITEYERKEADVVGFRAKWAKVLFQVGVLGVKPAPNVTMMWSFRDRVTVSDATFQPNVLLNVHPIFWHELGSKPPQHA
ncbi:MAG: hypothetical protein EON91_13520 [Brevundimonas sp.]|uniref:P-loop ATPase, Sll1717 family n=1 Tax=Brevundimonas sp. TaxID=1871086 RepID=UPI00121F5B86|nr:hypothetical protein [Brevundimonas sp.]RZJ16372.1 MAG: hypothetical protein EON91_13520 [Brevundimonas sp.]